MGEQSKKIGEYGEKVTKQFFSIIGWNDLAEGITLKCLYSNHLNEKGDPKGTHGIDFFRSYLNPLVSGQLNNVVISSKFKTEKYPNSPTKLFKGFMDDLTTTLECFESSEFKRSVIQGYNGYSTINDVGVLFWLNNNPESDDELISKISSARINTVANKTIYIVDNMRVAFILEVMKYIKLKVINMSIISIIPAQDRI